MNITPANVEPFTRDDLEPLRSHRTRPLGNCSYCDDHRHDPMMPWHTASPRCESGKRNHCSCDLCY